MTNKENKVAVISTMNAEVGIILPDLRLNKTWPKKGSKIYIDKDVLEEALYDPGTQYLFDEGILYIEDLEVKKELGLEPEDAATPENIIVLNNNQMLRYLKTGTMAELEDILKKLSHEQKLNMANFAIEQKAGDRDKCDMIFKYTGINVNKAIELGRTLPNEKEQE